jgi:hypothetical protein
VSPSAIVICSKGSDSINILLKSIQYYVPNDIQIYVSGYFAKPFSNKIKYLPNDFDSFGESYNSLINKAFNEGHENIVIANDDIVLTPYSWETLSEDVDLLLTQKHAKVGWVAARSDYARGWQNIITKHEIDISGSLKFRSESHILDVPVVAPIFASISKEAFVDFPPINWYSDDVQCFDIQARGYKHFISRCYVHHIGSQTIGKDYEKERKKALSWLTANRPNVVQELGFENDN